MTTLRFILLATLVSLTSCTDSSRVTGNTTTVTPVVSRTDAPEYVLWTVKHDNHLWVLVENRRASQGTTAVHHPDCPCLKKP